LVRERKLIGWRQDRNRDRGPVVKTSFVMPDLPSVGLRSPLNFHTDRIRDRRLVIFSEELKLKVHVTARQGNLGSGLNPTYVIKFHGSQVLTASWPFPKTGVGRLFICV
jgi:hypothetical protein